MKGAKISPADIADIREGGSRRPVVLLAATCLWSCTPKLAIALTEAGCGVVALSPKSHLLNKTSAVSARFVYRASAPLRALNEAIAKTAPALIIPCDERAVEHLHRLHQRTSDPDLKQLIEHSIGAPSAFPVVEARAELLRLAESLGIAIPETREIRSEADLFDWARTHSFPWVLKADGSWGGEGVKIVETPAQARRAYRALTKKIHLVFALRQFVLRQSLFALTPWLHSPRRRITVQSFIEGVPANCAIAAWEGKPEGGIGVEVLSADGKTGPAAVVRVVEDSRMVDAGSSIVAALGLFGLVGFDFILDSERKPWLLEMNARATPICHLHLGPGHDLVAPLAAHLTGRADVAQNATSSEKIALYPQALFIDGDRKLLQGAYLDTPLEDPLLARLMMRRPFLDRRSVAEFLNLVGLDWAARLLKH